MGCSRHLGFFPTLNSAFLRLKDVSKPFSVHTFTEGDGGVVRGASWDGHEGPSVLTSGRADWRLPGGASTTSCRLPLAITVERSTPQHCASREPAAVLLVTTGGNKMKERPTHKQIAVRAREIFIESGCLAGHDVDNWLQAEYELLELPVRELAELPPPPPNKNKTRRKSVTEVVRLALL